MSDDRTQVWRIRTPEGVSFSFRLASPALRCLALAIDAMTIGAAWSVVSSVIGVLEVFTPDIAAAISIVAYFILSQGYRIATEWLWRGQTLGKRVLRLRVVDAQGMRLSFPQVALRNLLRFVDALPFAYLVGGVSAILNKKAQRLGDLAAGTLVIWEPPQAQPDSTQLRSEKYNSLRQHPTLVARLRQSVGPVEARIAWEATARRDRLDPEARIQLFSQLSRHIREVSGMPSDALQDVADEQFVRNVVEVLYLTRGR